MTDDTKETVYSKHNRTDAHMNSKYCGSTHKTCTGSSRIGSQHWEGIVGACCQRENQFSPMEYCWLCWPHSRVGLMPRNRWLIQNEFNGIFWTTYFIWFFFYSIGLFSACFAFVVCGEWDFMFLFCFFFSFVFFSFEWEHEVVRVRSRWDQGEVKEVKA